jgi:hypothetical protein
LLFNFPDASEENHGEYRRDFSAMQSYQSKAFRGGRKGRTSHAFVDAHPIFS